MNILVFDTETIDIDHPFCYNVGYVIVDTETKARLLERDYVVEQVWENKMLFSTAYYADKKQKYVSALRGRKAKIKHWGHIMQRMIKDIQEFEVEYAYAYNSPFDVRVFDFNSEWFKTSNALDYVKTIDIRGLISHIVFSKEYKEFCEKNKLFTDGDNYQANAESLTRFLRQTNDFVEDHTALSDSIIESEILLSVMEQVDITQDKKVYNIVPREIERDLVIEYNGVKTAFSYFKKRVSKDKIVIKSKTYYEEEKKRNKELEIERAKRKAERERRKKQKEEDSKFEIIED